MARRGGRRTAVIRDVRADQATRSLALPMGNPPSDNPRHCADWPALRR